MGIGRKINELDYITGEVIRMFATIQMACDTHGIERNSIYNAINHRDGYMHQEKLRFAYVGAYEMKKVRQLDYDTGELIEVYNSAEAAADDNFIVPKALREALRLRNGYIHSKKLRFEYVN